MHLHYENALKFIRRCENKYDLIIVGFFPILLALPEGFLFTREFYGNCYNALKEWGWHHGQSAGKSFLFWRMPTPLQRMSQRRIASTFQIGRVYQAHIPTFAAGYWLFGFAAKSTIRWMIWIREHGTPLECFAPAYYTNKASQRRIFIFRLGGNASVRWRTDL
ncbi:MAG: hypothetical protein ACLU6Y_18710 [Ruminococcus sp.]